ncbi:phage holin family protein [Pseudoxanthomonas taiwanensis]|uniref:Phage holin family protein n=1 Tax=Pseudoxanthomonas taiwanensis TaxID=176598 RepID=A0A921NRZ8_9GAMM|nr:phage holin family protein [Pseudoxanthomonas taiwanensis]KAF1684430.1 hypothetical protein CR938_13980 [Pseudoxanthomonas taiwanensis]
MEDGERQQDAAAGGRPGAAPPPPLDESLRQIGQAGRATLQAWGEVLRPLRALLSADLALARSAMGRALAWAGVAIGFGASAWLLAPAAGVALMQQLGLSWLASLSIAALFNLAVTALAAWRTSRYFDWMGLHATRRQLARMGLFDEDDDGDGDAEAPTAPPPSPAPPPATDGDTRA